jgi:hypothetical protein
VRECACARNRRPACRRACAGHHSSARRYHGTRSPKRRPGSGHSPASAADASTATTTFSPSAEQKAQYDAWPADKKAKYDAWPASQQEYFWSLAPDRQAGWWALSDQQRGQVFAMTPDQREQVWPTIVAQVSGKPSAAAAPPGATGRHGRCPVGSGTAREHGFG